ncbi:helix-turn-helix domain-containing protein [Actinomycetota bacterium Odt1-20B]
MSNATTPTTPTTPTPPADTPSPLRPVPEPQPLTGLTGTPAAIYTALLTTPGVTAAELALAAGLGRSTTGKALAALEQHGLAIREPGGHRGAIRTPDHWHPAPTSPSPTPRPSPSPTDKTGGTEAQPSTNTAPDTPTDEADQATTPPPPTVIALPVRKHRLAPGTLRKMVSDYLRAHPGEALTATKISRVIEKSSGAIANALVVLVKQGIAEQVTARPRTFRLAGSGVNDNK